MTEAAHMAEAAMPLQNRVAPDGSIVAIGARGTVMGNRGGAIHGPQADTQLPPLGQPAVDLLPARVQWPPSRAHAARKIYRALLPRRGDGAAAGHRPCGECRRQDFSLVRKAMGETKGLSARAMAEDMDAVLHDERLTPERSKRTYATISRRCPVARSFYGRACRISFSRAGSCLGVSRVTARRSSGRTRAR